MYLKWFKERKEEQIEETYQMMKDWVNDGGLICCLFKNQCNIHEITYAIGTVENEKEEDVWLKNDRYDVLGFFDLKKEFGLEDVKKWFDECESGRSMIMWKKKMKKDEIRNVGGEYEV